MDYFKTLHEQHTSGHLRLDIGANLGGHTNLLRLNGDGPIFVYEPIPHFAAGLEKRFADDPGIFVFQLGISDAHVERTGLQIFEAWTIATAEEMGGRRVAESSMVMAGLGPREGFTAQFVTVDQHLADLRAHGAYLDAITHAARLPISVMKIDVDGDEPKVLTGALATILKDRPRILFELSNHVLQKGHNEQVMLDGVYQMGYALWTLEGDQQIKRSREYWRSFYPWNTSFDVLMLPEE